MIKTKEIVGMVGRLETSMVVNMKKVNFILVFGMVVLVSLSFVSGLSINQKDLVILDGENKEKAISQVASVSSNSREIVEAGFNIVNDMNSKKRLRVERYLNDNEELVSSGGMLMYKQRDYSFIPYLEFKVILDKGQSQNFNIYVKYKKLLNSYLLPQIIVYDDTSGEMIYHSEINFVSFACDKDNFCNLVIGENYGNCPNDCLSGGEDAFCDMVEDGECDPDCLTELDPDCITGEGKTIPVIPDYVDAGEKGIVVNYNLVSEIREYEKESGIPDNPKVAIYGEKKENTIKESKSIFSILGRVIANIFN